MAQVGKVEHDSIYVWHCTDTVKPLCDIDIQSEITAADDALVTPEAEQADTSGDAQQPQKAPGRVIGERAEDSHPNLEPASGAITPAKHSSLATPAVRGLLKEFKVDIRDVTGSGKDGRVLKEDVHKFVSSRDTVAAPAAQDPNRKTTPIDHGPQRETLISLTPIQSHMFKTMTRSLSIPHFLYADEINLTPLSTLRESLKAHPTPLQKLSYLPFIIKAMSIALKDYPLLNARVETSSEKGIPPKLIMREKHNIGIAMDTPQGLHVPNIKNVAALSILDIADQLMYLQSLARASKLSATDLTGGTITVSNIGSIGGTYVSPVLVQSEVAILGVGKARTVPAFNEKGEVVKKHVGNFSWSADHRVVDGATMARMGERVRVLLEEPGMMLANLR